jgi:hypothetical protein
MIFDGKMFWKMWGVQDSVVILGFDLSELGRGGVALCIILCSRRKATSGQDQVPLFILA